MAPDNDRTYLTCQRATLVNIADNDLRRREHDAPVVADDVSTVKAVEDVVLNLLHLCLLLVHLLYPLIHALLELLQQCLPFFEYVCHYNVCLYSFQILLYLCQEFIRGMGWHQRFHLFYDLHLRIVTRT